MSGSLTIQKAIYDALISNPNLITKLGGEFIFDAVPDNQKPPYINFGKIKTRDWDTSLCDGLEHDVEILVWSKKQGRKELQTIIDLLRTTIEQISGLHNGHVIANSEHIETITEHDQKSGLFKAALKFRHVSETQI